jgi:hypothetical protein
MELGSPSLPSPLQSARGAAATIQFPPGISGESPGGFERHAILAGPPKQIAVPIPHVKVGVTKIRIKFVGFAVPSRPQSQSVTPSTENGIGGQIAGSGGIRAKFGVQVSAENIGSHSSTFNPSPIGTPNIVGSHPGASGAQFRGVAIHPPQPKPQLNPCIILSTFVTAVFIFSLRVLLSLKS